MTARQENPTRVCLLATNILCLGLPSLPSWRCLRQGEMCWREISVSDLSAAASVTQPTFPGCCFWIGFDRPSFNQFLHLSEVDGFRSQEADELPALAQALQTLRVQSHALLDEVQHLPLSHIHETAVELNSVLRRPTENRYPAPH